MKKLLKISLVTVLSVLIIVGGFLYYSVRKSLPTVAGNLTVSGLSEDVKVYRDKNGVPTIEAKNDSDLYRAQGFIEAQDRLFQMDMARRQASGRLSEIVGKVALENDKKFIVFSLRKAAEKSYDKYSVETKKVLDDFSQGINEYIKYAKENGKLPYEFKLLGYEPENWTPIDSLVVGKYMAYDLGGHWNYQAFNNYILNTLGEDKLKELLPKEFAENKDTSDIIKANLGLQVDINEKNADLKLPPVENGSNNWVISGEKTKSGKSLIADDPHLSLGTPSIWYQVHLKSPNVDVNGVIFGGLPGVMLGHNKDIAWAVTNVGPDVQDLYIEKENPEKSHQFEYDGQWYDAEVNKYEIKVKNDNSESFEVVTTKHGPIINELLKPLGDKKNQKFSMKWAALESTQELEAVLSINKATDWESFEKGLENFKAPAQNFLFADNKGNIGYKANGLIPIRKKGNGNLPVPGNSSEYEWDKYIPYNELPKLVNPKEGYISTANTNTIEDYKYHISNVWAQPYRKARIDEVLSSGKDFTVDDMKKLQMDTKDLYAKEFLPKLLDNVDKKDIPENIYTSLTSWNYVANKDSSEQLIYDRWMTKIRENLFKDKVSKEVYKFMPNKESYIDRLLRNSFNGQESSLVKEVGGNKKLVTDSFKAALAELEQNYGKDSTKWKWGDYHKLGFRHPLTKSSALLAKFLNPKEEAISGSKVTVMAARQNEEGLVNHGASWRFVYDFSDNTGYHIVAPGQSGHFLSPYYDNQVQNWINGTYNAEKLDVIEKDKELTLTAK